ncbi:MAG: hypothetical protein ACI30R_08790, partial [Sodaliphilus sp.]
GVNPNSKSPVTKFQIIGESQLGSRVDKRMEGLQNQSVEEVNRKFDEDLDRFENDELPVGSRLELGMPSNELRSAGFPDLPISMRSSLLKRKAGMERHPFSASELKGLVNAIQKPIAVFQYSKENMRNLIADVTHGDKHFLVGVTLNYKSNGIEINSVSGLFPKESAEWTKWIQDGKTIRIDQKDKVLSLIDSLRTNPAESERIGLDLDSVSNLVENFENPSISGENIADGGASYREVDDEQQIEWLEKQPTVKVYRSMALIDGKLYPPMNSIDEMGELGNPEEVGKWTESVEHPENAFEKNGKWYFNLLKFRIRNLCYYNYGAEQTRDFIRKYFKKSDNSKRTKSLLETKNSFEETNEISRGLVQGRNNDEGRVRSGNETIANTKRAGEQAVADDADLLFRDDDNFTVHDRAIARDAYEQMESTVTKSKDK